MLHTSLNLATHLLGLLTQLAVAGAGSLAKLQLRIYWFRCFVWVGVKCKIKLN